MALLVVLAYTVACAGVGTLLLRVCAGRAWPAIKAARLPLFASALILGQAMVAALWTFAGLAEMLIPSVTWPAMASLFLVSTLWLWPIARDAFRAVGGGVAAVKKWPWSLRLPALALALLVSGFAIAAWIKPPFGDAEAFYMTYAKIIGATGHLEPMPGLYSAFSTIGLVAELHFAVLMQAAGTGGAKLFVWFVALAAARVLAAVCGRAGLGTSGVLVACVMLFTTTAFTHHIWDGKTDLFAAALGLSAVFWVSCADARWRRFALILAGACTGFAVVAKFSYALAFVPAVAILVVWSWPITSGAATADRRPLRVAIGELALFGVAAIAAVLPHLIKNAVMFAAPLAPFIGGGMDKSWLQQIWFSADDTRRILLTYPFALAFGRYPMQGGNISFLVLAFLPLAAWLPRPAGLRDSVILRLTVAAVVGTALWMALRPSVIAPRYFLATLLLFIPLAAKGAERFLECESAPRWVSAGIVATMLAALALFSYPILPAVKASLQAGRSPLPACALASVHCAPLRRLNAVADAGDRVFLLSYYAFWLRPDLLQCRDSYREGLLLHKSGGPGLTWEALARGGFRFVVADKIEFADELQRLEASDTLPGSSPSRLVETEEIVVFELPKATLAATVCRREPPATWVVHD